MFAARNAFMTPPPGPPTITSLSPTSSNNGGATVTISGTNFVPGATAVRVGGTVVATTVNSRTQLTCSFPGLSRGAKTVEVITASGTATSTYTYTITPYITGISPSTVYFDYGSGYTIYGGNFWGSGAGSVYVWETGGYYGISIASDGQLSFNPGALGVGNYTAQVTAPDGWSNGVGISSIYYPAPSISGVSDGRGGAGSQAGSTITLSGSNFARGTTSVSIGGVAVSASISASSISFSCPNLGGDGTRTITVTTSGSGNQSASTSVYFWGARGAELTSYTSGSGTYTMPGWANSVTVTVRGGGGGGGSGSGGLTGAWGGGGGAGGAAQTTWSRSSGTSISWSVGGGGAGALGTVTTPGAAGGTTSAAGISAAGGAGGCTRCNGAAGAGGSALGPSPAPTGGGAGNSAQPGGNPGSGGGGGNSAFGPYPGIAGRAGAVYFSASQ